MDSFVENAIQEVRQKVGDGKVLLALSGGVDSSVLAALLAKAIGKQLTCVFVDHGLLRKGEAEQVEETFKDRLNFKLINAEDEFIAALAGVRDPEKKREIIGHKFIEVFEREAKKFKIL